MSSYRCPACVAGACACRGGGEQLLLDGLDDERRVVPALELGLQDVDDAEGVGAAGDDVAGVPGVLAHAEGSEVGALTVDEKEGRHGGTIPRSSFDIVLRGGEADGAYFAGHALRGRMPAQIRIAVGSDVGPALLDLPEDALELGEHVVIYELEGAGHVCGRGGCRKVAYYALSVGELSGLRRQRPRSRDDVA